MRAAQLIAVLTPDARARRASSTFFFAVLTPRIALGGRLSGDRKPRKINEKLNKIGNNNSAETVQRIALVKPEKARGVEDQIYTQPRNLDFNVEVLTILQCAVQRIALVKPEKARGVEDQILRAARMGQARAPSLF